MKSSLLEYSNKIAVTNKLTTLEETVLKYILEDLQRADKIGVRGIAKNTFTSNTTIIRLSKKIGYSGYSEMLYNFKNKSQGVAIEKDNSVIDTKMFNITEQQMNDFQEYVFSEDAVVFIYATGFSELIAEYIYKKLMIRGVNCIFASGGDCTSLFNRVLPRVSTIIVVSKSGETSQVLHRTGLAKENGVNIISFSGENNSALAKLTNLNIVIEDRHKTDDDNIQANPFFGYCIIAFEKILSQLEGIML